MADPTPEELELRRRARRRLIGAIALAVFAVLVLPMIFDPEPKPLGNDVEIRIPDMAEPMPAPVAPAAETEGLAEAAAPATTQAGVEAPEKAKSAAVAPPAPAPRPVASKPAETKPSETKPAEGKKTAEETKQAEAAKPAPSKPEAAVKSAPASATAGYYLQLGVFTSEANARQLADKAAKSGFKAQVIRDGAQYRVRVGPYGEREQAQDIQARLKAKDFTAVVIKP